MSEAKAQGNVPFVNFVAGTVGGGIVGGMGGLLGGALASGLFLGTLTPDSDSSEWVALLLATGGTSALLGIVSLVVAASMRRNVAICLGSFLGCSVAAVIWIVTLAAAAGTR